MTVKEAGVHLVYKESKVVGFFTRDEESNENLVFVASKASLDDIKDLLTKDEKKV